MKRDIDQYAKDYATDVLDFENVIRRYRYKKILEALRNFKASRVLEVGCGPNSLLEFYRDWKSFVIVEPSTVFCEQARASAFFTPGAEAIADLVENRLEELRHKNFDFIILSSLLHEVREPREMLRGLRSLCGPKTILHVNVTNAESFHFLWAMEAGLIERVGAKSDRFVKLQQTSIFTLETLTAMLEEEGYAVIERGSYFIKPFNHAKMQKAMEYGLLDEALLDGLYGLSSRFPDTGAELFANCRAARP